MNYRFSILLAFLLISSNLYAYISSDGDEFTVKYNEHGAILTSVHDKHYWIGTGVEARTVAKKAIIYLGKSCDVSSEFYGQGTWAWANGGFILKFSDKRLAFARQDIAIKNNGGCRM